MPLNKWLATNTPHIKQCAMPSIKGHRRQMIEFDILEFGRTEKVTYKSEIVYMYTISTVSNIFIQLDLNERGGMLLASIDF